MNVSFQKQSISLSKGRVFYVIDALYLMEIKEKKELLNKGINNFDNVVREQIFKFPMTQTPFAVYEANDNTFMIERIKKVKSYRAIDDSIFSTDTGLILFIRKDVMIDLLQNYDYYDLVDSNDSVINTTYWNSLTSNFEYDSIALISSPGIGFDIDFTGSGIYQIC